MAITVGDPMPDATLKTLTAGGVRDVSTGELFSGKKVVLLAVPGAFTPTCSDTHLPGFLARADQIKAKGADTIACIAVHDAFVMAAWGRDRGVGEQILMLADGNGELTRALGLELDASAFGLGSRSRRFAAIIDDGVVSRLGVEPAGEVGVSSAEAVLADL